MKRLTREQKKHLKKLVMRVMEKTAEIKEKYNYVHENVQNCNNIYRDTNNGSKKAQDL